MDMITQVQLEDAVKNLTLVADRMKEVAFKVLTLGTDRPSQELELKDIYLDGFRIGRVADREDYCHVRISCRYFTPSGEPRDDEFEDSGSTLVRYVDFPMRYLYETDERWEDEVAKKGRNQKRFSARRNLDGMRQRIVDDLKKIEESRKKLRELEELAAEEDE